MTRRGVLLASAAAGGLAALSGCATGGIVNREAAHLGPDNAEASPPGGTITIWSWDVAAQAMVRLGKEFERRHPGTRIRVLDVGYDNVYDKITVGLTADSGLPDVLTVEGSQLPVYIGNFPRGLHDLTALAARYRPSFDPAAWRTVTDDRGHVFALPWDIGPCGLFYRADHFRHAGIDPATLATWDDYLQAGIALRRRTGKAMLILDPTSDGLLPLLLQQQGQSYFTPGPPGATGSAAGPRLAVDTPAARRAMELLRTFVRNGLVDWENGWDGLVSGTQDGKAATTPTAAWWDGTLTSEMPALRGRFGVLPLPAFERGGCRTSNNGGSTLCITSQSRNPRLAWAFITFLLADKENQVSMLKNEGLFPSYLPALADPYFRAPDPYYAGRQATMGLFAQLAGAIPAVTESQYSAQAADIMTTTVQNVLLGGADPDGSLRSARRQLAGATGLQTTAGQ